MVSLLTAMACKKDNPDGSRPDFPTLPGTLYYQWADEGVFKVDLSAGQKSLLLPDKADRNGWDISWDGQYMLQALDAPDQDYDANLYTITRVADGTVVAQFKYYPEGGSITTGSLSPNGKWIAIAPTFEEGIVILDWEGNRIQHLEKVNNQKIEGKPVWMPDNTVLFKHGNALIKANNTFDGATVLKQLDFQDWDNPTVSKDGKKIAFAANSHIWLMNSDGTNMKQVTASDAAENHPQFSPDGNYLLIGTDYHVTGPFGRLWYLKVIPADGKQYQVEDGQESEGVVRIQFVGENQLEAADGKMIWR